MAMKKGRHGDVTVSVIYSARQTGLSASSLAGWKD